MGNLALKIECQSASFRNPDFQNFQKTLDLPPPTTIIGFIGAAFGLSPKSSQEYFQNNKIEIGVYGTSRGKCRDTWKYSKRTKDMWLYKSDLDGSIIQKEYLIHASFLLIFKSTNEVIDDINRALSYPIYALTFGNSDSLTKIVKMEKDIKEVESYEVENSIIEGNVIEDVFRNQNSQLDFSIYQSSESISFDLPVAFEYQNDYGKRHVSKINTYSFIGKKIKLNYSLKGAMYENNFIPLINII